MSRGATPAAQGSAVVQCNQVSGFRRQPSAAVYARRRGRRVAKRTAEGSASSAAPPAMPPPVGFKQLMEKIEMIEDQCSDESDKANRNKAKLKDKELGSTDPFVQKKIYIRVHTTEVSLQRALFVSRVLEHAYCSQTFQTHVASGVRRWKAGLCPLKLRRSSCHDLNRVVVRINPQPVARLHAAAAATHRHNRRQAVLADGNRRV